jgi:uncharacterized protein (DUF305 family)
MEEVSSMGRNATLAVAVALIAAGLAGLGFVLLFNGGALGGVGGFGDGMGGGMGMGGSGFMGDGRGERVDGMFIQQMVPHHEDAIAMAELALERSERPEIRQLAEDIRRSQTEENAQMRAWYREWYGTDVPEGDGRSGGMGMMGGAMHDQTDIEALEGADDFDREFLEQMIPHHEMALMMTRMVSRAGEREALRELAQDMHREQSREIELMEGWYRDWYGK